MTLTSVQKALRVVDHLADKGSSGVSEISRSLGVTVGTAHRLVTTLVEAGYVIQHPDKRYGLGSKIAEIARKIQPAVGLVETARAHLEQLSTLSDETVNLAVLREDQVLYVDRVVADQMLAVAVRVGSRAPVFATALGRALLANVDPQIRASFLKRLASIAQASGREPPGLDALQRVLVQVAKQGYAEEDGEFAADVACVAAPVFDGRGRVVAAVSIAGPRSRIRKRRNDLIPMVRTAAGEISKAIEALGEQVEL